MSWKVDCELEGVNELLEREQESQLGGGMPNQSCVLRVLLEGEKSCNFL